VVRFMPIGVLTWPKLPAEGKFANKRGLFFLMCPCLSNIRFTMAIFWPVKSLRVTTLNLKVGRKHQKY
jgi:hypothetical protein